MKNDAAEKPRPFSDVPQDGVMRAFHGAVSPAIARVYATWTPTESNSEVTKNLQLSGQIIGPFCEFAQTLPARMPLVDRGPGEMLIAEAVVPDPCCWTPELPFTYRAHIELRRDNEVIQRYERNFGIRRWGVRGRDFLFEGKRFVLRGGSIRDSSLSTANLPSADDAIFARQTSTAFFVANPSDALCEFATHRGIMLVADLHSMDPGDVPKLLAEIHRLAAWPAVFLAIVPHRETLFLEANHPTINLPLAACSDAAIPPQLPPWASVALIDVTESHLAVLPNFELASPVIVRRRSSHQTLEQARAACDRLQRECAVQGEWAGFLA